VEVATDESMGLYRDSRGLALALIEDYEGAIEDFEFYMQWSRQYPGYRVDQGRLKRQAWIKALEEGRNPFDEAMLEALRNE
jgi:hypothetical protein